MAQGKQAKIISVKQEASILRHVESTRHPERDRVIVLLSLKAGLRAKEVARLTWAMVTDSEGQIAEVMALEDQAAKGKSGRIIPMNPVLKQALTELQAARGEQARPAWPVIYSERGRGLSAKSVALWFGRLYQNLGMDGCSSHSGRRTFITRLARKAPEAGGSLRDVQQLAGHASLQSTQRYVEGDSEAKRKLVAMV